ncbi:hypothetical protein ASD24_13440 [Paenibacillus sp. Root52]|uniref:hypothetical protein n=1 Tax=Paenibacillus sp. Root52 TaxID=1736552 RepID=UPI0006FA53BE|nr:hypothetical protein [Paenibacillus sp. Root52]KQY83277.1 hypothetical protein ASD24_13440 [Paenibacillus sp. Root52]
MKHKILISIISVVIILTGIYLYKDREIIALKTGTTPPLQWDDPYENKEEPIQLTAQNQTLSNPDVHLTEVYYLPKSKKLQFGLWYRKKDYQPNQTANIPDRIFQVTIQDTQGQIFNDDTVVKTEGIWDEFQRRSISIDLDHLENQGTIEVTVSLIAQDGTTITPLESASFKVTIS